DGGAGPGVREVDAPDVRGERRAPLPDPVPRRGREDALQLQVRGDLPGPHGALLAAAVERPLGGFLVAVQAEDRLGPGPRPFRLRPPEREDQASAAPHKLGPVRHVPGPLPGGDGGRRGQPWGAP
ncbi:unnamed protein product, partial [Ectocarpus fasciculatus]